VRLLIAPAILATLTTVAPSLPASSGAAACPPAVTDAVLKAHPGATVGSCEREEEKGKTQFEVRLSAKDGKRVEVDVTPEGKILATEETVPLADLPPAVAKAFAAKYGSEAPSRAVMETSAEGRVTYELRFAANGKKKEATFAADGGFLEEE
jgi:hypothetical protein